MDNKKTIAIMTSGGDAPGMNPAVRAVVRAALHKKFDVYAIYEGYKGMVAGGDYIRKMTWKDVGGILNKGGTVIGSARSETYRDDEETRRKAVYNLITLGIDALVVIGGDGSLTGANVLRVEWARHVDILTKEGKIKKNLAEKYPSIFITGLVGSIDNDMCGTDMTIGADTALFRITEAVDAIMSTAASHQRTFVIKVMGRNCGYLAIMAGLACGADYVFVPEDPPEPGIWEKKMCDLLKAGRKAGRRDSIVIMAEGACDTKGNRIGSTYVKKVLKEQLKEDVRITILGHVQRGGVPSSYDRYMTTMLGCETIERIEESTVSDEPLLIGVKENDIIARPLMECVADTRSIRGLINEGKYQTVMDMRGGGFNEAYDTLNVMINTLPNQPKPGQKPLRIAVLHAGAPSAGMNTAAATAIRIGLEQGHIMLGVQNGFRGLIKGNKKGNIREMTWQSVSGWGNMGGAELGISRDSPKKKEYYAISRQIEENKIDAILMIGGWSGYEVMYNIYSKRETFPAFDIPMVCLPAAINNNLPGSERSVGADTALNNIVEAIDKIRQSAVASNRCFVVEVMGRYCGFLALASGIATGAERVYLHEEGVTLKGIVQDLDNLRTGFDGGSRLGLIIRNERASKSYDTAFLTSLFGEEGRDDFKARSAILGHIQQGGDPSPFDRILAIRLARRCVDHLVQACSSEHKPISFIGMQKGKVRFFDMARWPGMIDKKFQRPKDQWWMEYRPLAKKMAEPPK